MNASLLDAAGITCCQYTNALSIVQVDLTMRATPEAVASPTAASPASARGTPQQAPPAQVKPRHAGVCDAPAPLDITFVQSSARAYCDASPQSHNSPAAGGGVPRRCRGRAAGLASCRQPSGRPHDAGAGGGAAEPRRLRCRPAHPQGAPCAVTAVREGSLP